MIRSRFIRTFALSLTSFLAISCSDYKNPTSPQAELSNAAPADLSIGLVPDLLGTLNQIVTTVTGVLYPEGKRVTAVKWAAGHVAAEYRATAVIGSYGGTISVPGADFAVTFSPGALSQPTAITIIAKGGEFVAYDMLPHGLKFSRPVVARQLLRNTAVYNTPAAKNIQGAYLPDGNDGIGLNGEATTVETLTSSTLSSLVGQLAAPQVQLWELKHFSRYILASGCDGNAPPPLDPE